MSLYHETAEFLTSSSASGGSLKSRIFGKKDLKSQPAQVYALAIESSKWSAILKEVIERTDLLRLERKITPVLSVLLVHDLLLAKRGIAIPATHGLRTSVERHKARLTAEFTKSRIRRKLSTVEALKAHIEAGLGNTTDSSQILHPRWVRINTLKTTLEEQLESTFAGLERALTVDAVRKRGSKHIFIDHNIPNLVAVSSTTDLSKTEAYKSGAIIFQDKASCFPAYLLDPRSEDDDIIDSCAAPGNKTTHLAAILQSRQPDPNGGSQKIHAFERNYGRADTLKRMVSLAGSDRITTIHAGEDFLKAKPEASTYKKVTSLLLDPSCSGSGIVGRDDMPELHLPVPKNNTPLPKDSKNKKQTKVPDPTKETRKRKREDFNEDLDVMVDDDGMVTAVDTVDELNARLTALSKFQLELLIHAFKFPSARRITYSTCSIHAQENEQVVLQALKSSIAKEQGWRLLKRADQIRGLKEWPVRGDIEAAEGDAEVAEACIRANKGDEHGTMGFFLAGFVRDSNSVEDIGAQFLRDEHGHMVRDMMGFPVRAEPMGADSTSSPMDEAAPEAAVEVEADEEEEEEEWGGIEDDQIPETKDEAIGVPMPTKNKQPKVNAASKHQHNPQKKRADLASLSQKKKKRKK
ncbi:S-adenosyl-L-methionine-dependent methyltransferase [Glarea lozoyensis ATCC 20868]|uniref:S-adenosyl-L-methionine-dependent methyltransferase n=1 Tax=Glarea lozoyensis (strain ATCC 20868 / MF5171) TaxID=1116229 RepID=S3DHY0_GLAL2|nr:S-adenosyl-L-methionine-dependent methyltransferase [Glarea lozoyensis ATCC 20868]EPE36749.1 S-adenosyl-L-methionine-dependent methyltransferase [Glarea lozoyensis ATCC 20868]